MSSLPENYRFDRARYEAYCAEMEAREKAWVDEVADVDGARKALKEYVAQLDSRFLLGGWFDTRCIPTGEEFVEFVCGGEVNPLGSPLCRCFSPHVAVRIFIDTVERYIASRPQKYGPSRHQTLYWRVHPMLMVCDTGEWTGYDVDLERTVTKRETLFNVRARLLIA